MSLISVFSEYKNDPCLPSALLHFWLIWLMIMCRENKNHLRKTFCLMNGVCVCFCVCMCIRLTSHFSFNISLLWRLATCSVLIDPPSSLCTTGPLILPQHYSSSSRWLTHMNKMKLALLGGTRIAARCPASQSFMQGYVSAQSMCWG